MENLIINFCGSGVQRQEHAGRCFFVANATLVVSGVLDGSRGPVFYPSDELAKSVPAWNNKPITLGHPGNGRGIADSPGTKILGFVRNALIERGNLRAELWFDREILRRSEHEQILNSLNSGKRIELSTGLHLESEFSPGTFLGQSYDAVARNLRPDHLAILVDEAGACSIQDGCGVFATNESGCGGDCFRCGRRDTCPKSIVAPPQESATPHLPSPETVDRFAPFGPEYIENENKEPNQ